LSVYTSHQLDKTGFTLAGYISVLVFVMQHDLFVPEMYLQHNSCLTNQRRARGCCSGAVQTQDDQSLPVYLSKQIH